MWSDPIKKADESGVEIITGFKLIELYKDPYTGKYKRVSTTLTSNST